MLLMVLVAFFVLLKGMALYSASQMPDSLGLTAQNTLQPCPASPNCACSEEAHADRQVEPLPYVGTPEYTRDVFRQFIETRRGVTIRTVEADYVHATVATRLLGFVDDVEARFDDEARVIHLRSASRVGRSDLGANRRRLQGWGQAWIDGPERSGY